MLVGDIIGLRARHEEDVAILHAELYDDVDVQSRASARPWRPLPPGAPGSPYAVVSDPGEGTVCFSAIQLANGALVGAATMWGIDHHNRAAHLGLSLRPRYRGQGLSVDALRVMCHYGFSIRGLNRLQVETLADNEAMIRAALRAGFALEGTLRQTAWVGGRFHDELVLGALREEWDGEASA